MSNGYARITIAGNEVGLKFGFDAIREYSEAVLNKTKSYHSENGLTQYGWGKLLQCAYNNNCLLKEVEPVLTYEQFVEWIEDENNKEQFDNAVTIYADSTYGKLLVEKYGNKEDDEKKSLLPEQTLSSSSESATENLE